MTFIILFSLPGCWKQACVLYVLLSFLTYLSQSLPDRSLPNFSAWVEHTHTCLMCLAALCLGLSGWAGITKVKPIWFLLKQETASGSGISCQVNKKLPTGLPNPTHGKKWLTYCTLAHTQQYLPTSTLTVIVKKTCVSSLQISLPPHEEVLICHRPPPSHPTNSIKTPQDTK